MRLEDVYTIAADFVEDCMRFSDGRSNEAYLRSLVGRLPETMEWLQEKGLRFGTAPTIFVTRSKPRILPRGGGERIVETLATAGERCGVEFLYETTLVGLNERRTWDGYEVKVRTREGRAEYLGARAVILACGGFEGNHEMLVKYLGFEADQLKNISEGGLFNKGEGIEIALGLGAGACGEFGGFHAEPVDPRSTNPEPVVMLFPYGIMVNKHGRRFVDEASGTADESYEAVSREIWAQPGHVAYFITDQRVTEVPNREHALLTEKPPIHGATLSELAENLGIDPLTLKKTVEEFNDAAAEGPFAPDAPDGRTTTGLTPKKSNWAHPLDSPPYVAYPMSCAIVFTYGGLAVDVESRVLDRDGIAMLGLYAAGECTGLYYGKYPGATSVLRSLIFGKVAGQNAARGLMDSSTAPA